MELENADQQVIANQIPIVKQRGNLPIIIGVIFLLFLVGGGAYYLGINKNNKSQQIQPLTTTQNTPIINTSSQLTNNTQTTISAIPDETVNWKTYKSEICRLSIKYPSGWNVKVYPKTNSSYPVGYNDSCFVIESTDYKLYPQSDVNDGVAIVVRKTTNGTTYTSNVKNTSTVVNTLDDYIKAENSSVELNDTNGPINLISNIQDKTYGGLSGIYYLATAMRVDANFIFTGGNNIYNIIWSKDYSGKYKDQLETIISTLQVNN